MATRMPPLNALRAFESAARRGGFASAAAELHVTPAAVSHQVKSLESHLGLALFHRRPRGLDLTEAGRALLPQLSRGLDHLARAVDTVTAGGLSGTLTVSAAASFATLWLVPRLAGFVRAYPEIQVRLLGAGTVPADLRKGEADIRIPYGMGDYPGLDVRSLMRDEVFPVCAPSLLNKSPLNRMSDLRNHTLLHDVNVTGEAAMTWRQWLADAGVTGVDPEQGLGFGDAILLTGAAFRGLGVALGRLSLVSDDLASGRLVRPLKASRPSDFSYWTATTIAGAQVPRIAAFRRWLEEEAQRARAGAPVA